MDDSTKQALGVFTREFYETQAASFSQTRQNPWPGWHQLVQFLPQASPENPCSVLDVACGNMRFERFLNSLQHSSSWEFTGIDACAFPDEVPHNMQFYQQDILQVLQDKSLLVSSKKRFDVAVCFAFMHHVPTQDLRVQLLQQLLLSVHSAGICAVSFWRFMDNPKLAAKAQSQTKKLRASIQQQLGPHDFVLGWDNQQDVLRYCHHFTSEEIDTLLSNVDSQAQVLSIYHADGKQGNGNTYAVLKRR